jgi:hypothetical protein
MKLPFLDPRDVVRLVERGADAVVTEAERIVLSTDPLTVRLRNLLDSTEPSLVRLQPTLERLAETTDPHEVDATTVAPDLHDLLDVSRELNEMLAGLPGLGRIKKRIDEEQAEEGQD